MLVAVPLIVLTANQMTANQYPNTIPLQTGIDQILPLPARVNTESVVIDTLTAELNVSKRALKMTIKISNQTEKPIEIGEVTTANVQFINPNRAVQGKQRGYSDFFWLLDELYHNHQLDAGNPDAYIFVWC